MKIKTQYKKEDLLYNEVNPDTYELLSLIQIYFLDHNIDSYVLKKNFILYNHEALNNISEHAIVTDNFIFINSDYFDSLVYYHQVNDEEKKLMEFVKKHDSFFKQGSTEKIFQKEEYNEFVKTSKFSKVKEINKLINSLEVINFIKNISEKVDDHKLSESLKILSVVNPIVHMTDDKFINYLENLNLIKASENLKTEISFINNPNEEFDSLLDFSPSHKKFVIELKEKTMPIFIR